MKYLITALFLLSLSAFGNEHSHKKHNHGNPSDMGSYIKKLQDPERDEWQKPDEVFKAMGLKEGDKLCDIGAGPGYLSLKAAKFVGESGHVFSVDVENQMIQVLSDNIKESKLKNLSPILGLYDNPLLPPKTCDYILIVNTYHHFADRVGYLKVLKRALAPSGKLINIDFHKKDLPIGPKVTHKISEEDFLKEASLAGYQMVRRHDFLKYQYFFELRL